MVAQNQVPFFFRQALQAPAETFEPRIFCLGPRLGWRPAAALQSPALPRGLPQNLLIDEMGDAAEIPIRIARAQFDPFRYAAGDAIDGLVRQVFGSLAPTPLEEPDEPATDRLVESGRPVAVVGIELREERLETFLG